jgi:hypothetical protein
VYLRNTSRFDTDEVRRLLAIATAGVRMTRVAVHVKNSAAAYAGRAYERVPCVSSAPRSARRLVVVRIGPERAFPCDNTVSRVRWGGPWVARLTLNSGLWDSNARTRMKRVDGEVLFQQGEVIRHPYGGKRAPLITYRTALECLVAVTAHEARHIYQFQHNKRRSEVDCERFAAKALERYRATL